MGIDLGPAPTVKNSTSLLEFADLHKADKAVDHRCYYQVYEELLSPRRFSTLKLLEIGILNGGSHLTWADWMPKACIWGIDVKLPQGEVDESRILYRLCSQDDREKLDRLFPYNSLDVIIDDGSHVLYQQLTTCLYLWNSLRKDGYYIIEDIQDPDFIHYFQLLPGFMKACSFRDKTGRYDDTLVVLHKQ